MRTILILALALTLSACGALVSERRAAFRVETEGCALIQLSRGGVGYYLCDGGRVCSPRNLECVTP
jgi:hypothetical protein